jgi:hypothetical protein
MNLEECYTRTLNVTGFELTLVKLDIKVLFSASCYAWEPARNSSELPIGELYSARSGMMDLLGKELMF